MRRTPTLAALLLGATLLAPTGLATAAGATCRGEAATIVGTGTAIQGTAGRDVIITGTATDVDAGPGDDLVCTTGAASNGDVIDVDAGVGNDVVDSTSLEPGDSLHAVLGAGADTFVGGPGDDSVTAGLAAQTLGDPEPSEAELDVIDTGGGTDGVTSGGPGLPNDDVVRLGSGDDSVQWSGTMGTGGVLDAGGGEDGLNLRASGRTFNIDLAKQTLTIDGVRAASFSSFDGAFRVSPEPGLGAVRILGTDRGDGDTVEIDSPALVRADLGRGRDWLDLAGIVSGSTLDLGAGIDLLEVQSGVDAQDILSRRGSVELDLTKGRLVVNGSRTASIAGVEQAGAVAHESTVVGNDGANILFTAGCHTSIDGRGGIDDISRFATATGYDCDRGRATLRGGSGDDHLSGNKLAERMYGGSGDDYISTGPATEGINRAWGGPGDDTLAGGGDRDVLSGGAGNDQLYGSKRVDDLAGGAGDDFGSGGPGRDRCAAEVQRSCER